MGLSKSKTTVGPSKTALPQINFATDAAKSAYTNNQGNIDAISGTLRDVFDTGAANLGKTLNPVIDYYTGVLGRDPASNPELGNIIDTTNASVADKINALFSRAGQTGSSRQIGELGKRLSENESALRYNDYTTQLGQRLAAAQGLTSASGAQSAERAGLAALGGTAATLPYAGSEFLTGAIGNLWGNATTTKSSPSLGQMLLQAAANGAQAYASGGAG